MTEQHPITPPQELVEEWCYEDGDEIRTSPRWYQRLCVKAARWGADLELEACCEWLKSEGHEYEHEALFAARRPKPPSLKEQALKQLSGIETCFRASYGGDLITDTIRRALESLPDNIA